MDDIDTMISRAVKLIDQWEEEPRTRKLADLLQMQLTLLKVGIGIEKFNELPSFVRYLDEATKFISQDAKQHIAQLEQKWKLEESFTQVEDKVSKLGNKLGVEA